MVYTCTIRGISLDLPYILSRKLIDKNFVIARSKPTPIAEHFREKYFRDQNHEVHEKIVPRKYCAADGGKLALVNLIQDVILPCCVPAKGGIAPIFPR